MALFTGDWLFEDGLVMRAYEGELASRWSGGDVPAFTRGVAEREVVRDGQG